MCSLSPGFTARQGRPSVPPAIDDNGGLTNQLS
jgi:hypothetical protein